jgi:hypothetical protein
VRLNAYAVSGRHPILDSAMMCLGRRILTLAVGRRPVGPVVTGFESAGHGSGATGPTFAAGLGGGRAARFSPSCHHGRRSCWAGLVTKAGPKTTST